MTRHRQRSVINIVSELPPPPHTTPLLLPLLLPSQKKRKKKNTDPGRGQANPTPKQITSWRRRVTQIPSQPPPSPSSPSSPPSPPTTTKAQTSRSFLVDFSSLPSLSLLLSSLSTSPSPPPSSSSPSPSLPWKPDPRKDRANGRRGQDTERRLKSGKEESRRTLSVGAIGGDAP